MSARLDALRRSFTEARAGVDAIENRARGANRDLTDAEQTEVDTLLQRCEDLTPDIETEGARQDRQASAAAVLARIQPQNASQSPTAGNPGAVATVPTPGEYMSLLVRARRGDTEASELLTRVVAQQTTADTSGLLPKPIVGQIIKFADDRRQVWDSFSHPPMPNSGKTFTRPRITQRVLVAEQAAELDELASRKMLVTGTDVTKRTFGGTLELSRQDIDWTDPSALDLVIADFAGYYAQVTDIAAVSALTTAAAATSPWTTTSINTKISSFTAALQAAEATTLESADTIWLSSDQAWALAGETMANTGQSTLSLLKQTISETENPVKIISSPRLPANTRIIGNSKYIEAYEQQLGLMSLANITHLGLDVAYAGYIAFFAIAAAFVSVTGA